MGLRTTIINALGGVDKTQNSANVRGTDFLKYGNRSEPLFPDWSEIKMSDKDMYRGYTFAAIQKRGNKVASLARENLVTDAKPEVIDEFQKQEQQVIHPYLKAIQDSTVFSEKQFWKNISIYLDLAGRYYLGVVRKVVPSSNKNLPDIVTDVKEFIMLNPYEIRRVINKDKELAGYIERKKDGRYREWPKDMIISMVELNPFDPENSQWAMTDAAKQAIYTINQSGDYTRQSLHGNLDAPGIITTDVLLDDEDFANFKARVQQHTKGEPLFGNGTGAIKWDSMQIDLDKAALMDINEINRTEILAVSGTSKTTLGIEQSGTTRETARVQTDQFVSDTVQPRLEDIIDFLNLDYKQHYKKEFEKTGYKINVKSAVSRDYNTELQATQMRQSQLELARTLMDAGYTQESSYQYAQGNIELRDLELEKGLDKPKTLTPENPEGGEPSNENSPNSPQNGPQSDSGSGNNNNTNSEQNSLETAGNDGQDTNVLSTDLVPHSDLVENGGKGSGNHGHKGRPGKVGGSSKKNLLEKADEFLVNEMGSPYGSQTQLQNVVAANGFDKTPEQVSKEDYDKAIVEGGTEVFRGVSGDGFSSADEFVEDFIGGDYYVGDGEHGVGIYTTDSLTDADYYTTLESGAEGKTLKMVLSKDMKIVDSKDIYDEYRDFQTSKMKEYTKKSEAAYRAGNDSLGDKYDSLVVAYDNLDLTTYSAMKGYDVVRATSSAFGKENASIFVVLNRGKVKIQKGDPTIKWKDGKRVNAFIDNVEGESSPSLHNHEGCTCACCNGGIETYHNDITQEDADVLTDEYDTLLNSIREVQKEAINLSIENVTINSFNENDLISEEEKEGLIEKLKNAFQKYWWVILPLFATNLMNRRNKEFKQDKAFVFTNDIKGLVVDNAKTVATGHMETILNDILEASNKAYTRVLEKAAAKLIIDAYKKNPKKFEQYFKSEPTERKAISTIRRTDILEENQKIYQKANDMALEGYDRQSIVKAIRSEYTHLSKTRATTIARNETSRAFGQSQYQADLQFLKSINRLDSAYKQLYSTTGNPCKVCQALIDKGPIPFTKNFLDKGESLEIIENGKTNTFVANYEAISASTVHVNCRCRYKLVFKGEDGRITDIYNGVWDKGTSDSSSNTRSWLSSYSTYESEEINGAGVIDARGHLHAPAGTPEGGQFVKKDGGGGGISKTGKELFDSDIEDKVNVIRKMTTDEQVDFVNEAMKHADELPEGLNKDSAFQVVSYFLNNNKKPQVLDDSDFDKLVPENERVYRGVYASENMTAKQITNQLKYGDTTYQGWGDAITGTYYTSSQPEIEIYARKGGVEDVGRIAAGIDKTAKIWDDRKSPMCPWHKTTSTIREKVGSIHGISISDAVAIGGLLAGYDGVIMERAAGTYYVCMFNREKTLIRKNYYKVEEEEVYE